MRFMENLATIRKDVLGMTQAQLAEKLGLTQGSISRMETGELRVDERTQLAIDALILRGRATPA